MPAPVAVTEKRTAIQDWVEVEGDVAVSSTPQPPAVVLEAAVTVAIVVLTTEQAADEITLHLDVDTS